MREDTYLKHNTEQARTWMQGTAKEIRNIWMNA